MQEDCWPAKAIIRMRPCSSWPPSKSNLVTPGPTWICRLSLLGQLDQAADQYATALRLQPKLAEAQYNWALLFLKKRQPIEATVHYREALRLRPDYVDALNNLAWLLATSPEARVRDGAEAVQMAEKVCELSARKEARIW